MTAAVLLLALLPAADPRHVSSGLEVPAGFAVSVFADSTLVNDTHCMTITPDGRIVVAGRNYLRILTEAEDGKAATVTEFAHPPKDGANGLFWEGRDLWCVGDGGLRLFRDVDNGGSKKPSELVFASLTGSEHKSHAVARGPDGWLYLLVGDSTGVTAKTVTSSTSPVRDPIGGCVLRLSPDRKRVEVVADGFRNAYAMDWNADGELFTFDSDNERCASLPWSEPTRFYHVVSGGHHGWLGPRVAATWRKPPYFLDVVAPVATLGRGSPTGVVCYRHGPFPTEYRGGFFLGDWTFGVIHFVALDKAGSSYRGKPSLFARSVGDDGFAPTALAVHPKTGELFVSIGGRGTRGAVYRIRHVEGSKKVETEEAKRLTPKARSLEWKDGLATEIVRDAKDADSHVRRVSLELAHRHRAQLSTEQLAEIVRANATQKDRYVRQATARLILDKDAPRSLTYYLAFPSSDAAKFLDPDYQLPIPLDAVRLVQLALGDIGASSARGTVWEGYTPRRLDSVAAGSLASLRKRYPSGDADLDRELTRTFALIEDEDSAVLKKIAYTLTAKSHPTDDVHHLIVIARLKGKRTPAVTKVVADALIRLDAKIAARKMTLESNWPSRLRELHAGLAEKDPDLEWAIVGHREFGRPDHVLWTSAAGFDKARAASIFLEKSKDAGFVWNAALVARVGASQPEKALPVLRKLWGEAGLDDEILPVLAKQAKEEDHARFLRGLTSPSLALVGASLSALEKLDAKGDYRRDEGLALLMGAKQLPPGKEEDALRARILVRLGKLAGAKFTATDAASAWYAKQYPEQAKKLAAGDGVDAEAWQRRLERIDWEKGDAKRGQVVYTKASCATCHSGNAALGPDLAGVTGRFSRGDLFTAIVRPSKDVSPRYRTTQMTTGKGKVYSGIIVYDAVDSVLLQTGPTETVRLANTQITERKLTATSLMPMGLLDRLSDEEIADLYGYLRSLGKGSR